MRRETRNTRRRRQGSELVDGACAARERLGIAALAGELGLSTQRASALIWAHYEATGDDGMYVNCLDRGVAIVAKRAGLPVHVVEEWISDALEYVARQPRGLARVLKQIV